MGMSHAQVIIQASHSELTHHSISQSGNTSFTAPYLTEGRVVWSLPSLADLMYVGSHKIIV